VRGELNRASGGTFGGPPIVELVGDPVVADA
jgi:hypothetical protein